MLSRILVTHTDYEFKDTTEDFMLVHSQLLKPAPLRKARYLRERDQYLYTKH